jgi:hypothetical protein
VLAIGVLALMSLFATGTVAQNRATQRSDASMAAQNLVDLYRNVDTSGWATPSGWTDCPTQLTTAFGGDDFVSRCVYRVVGGRVQLAAMIARDAGGPLGPASSSGLQVATNDGVSTIDAANLQLGQQVLLEDANGVLFNASIEGEEGSGDFIFSPGIRAADIANPYSMLRLDNNRAMSIRVGFVN